MHCGTHKGHNYYTDAAALVNIVIGLVHAGGGCSVSIATWVTKKRKCYTTLIWKCLGHRAELAFLGFYFLVHSFQFDLCGFLFIYSMRTLSFMSAVSNVPWTRQICWGDCSDERYKSVWMKGIWLIPDTFPSCGWSELRFMCEKLIFCWIIGKFAKYSLCICEQARPNILLLSTGGPLGKADLSASVTISTVVCRLWALCRALHSIWLCKSRAALVHYGLTHCQDLF